MVEPELAAPTSADLLSAGPEASLGGSLSRSIALRAVTTATGAGVAWTAARLTGPRSRANTVGLVALVGTKLGQTLASGARDPLVVAAALGSAAVLVGIVQTPVVSQFFGCTPLDPFAWGLAAGQPPPRQRRRSSSPTPSIGSSPRAEALPSSKTVRHRRAYRPGDRALLRGDRP